ncbi:hypothetical protein H2202_002527 [Exophiala xenobiotica]|nr:hypothetical protein H2202_002527 [Exophiala xenobiotica]
MDDLLYISRNIGAATLLIATVATPLLSLIDTTRAVEYNLSLPFAAHSCFLVLSYVVGTVCLLVESIRSRGELPDATASLSNTLFVCIIVIRLESLPTKLKATGWYLNCAFWAVLQFIELSTAIRIALRPSSPSPYFQVGLALAIYRALTCLILLILFLRSYHKGYRSLAQSDLENTNSPNADTEDVDKDNEGGDAGPGITTADYLGLRREAYQEIEELGGWLPYVKKFRIFLQYTWPFGRRLLQIRFVMTFVLLVAQRFIGVQVPLKSAALIDAISSKRNPWRPFAMFFFLSFLNSNMCLSILERLTWIDVDVSRQKMLKKGAHFKVLNLDSYFHSFVQPTDIIKAVDHAESIDKLLDSVIFHLLPNVFTLFFAIYNIYRRFGPYMIIVVMYMVTAYAISEKRSLAATIEVYGKYVTARDNQERRRQDGVHGWQTVSVHNQVKHECDMYDAEVDSYMGQLRAYYIVVYFFWFIHSLIFQTSHIIGYALVILMVYTGRCTIGDLTAFLGLWSLLWDPVHYLTTAVGLMLEEFLDADRLRRIMEQKARVSYGIQSLEYDKGEVRLERLSFTYPGSKKVNIDGISLTIKGGTKVAFVGKSGAGKSTIFKLMMRQLLPTQGAVYIDGQDIATLSRDSLHENIGVMQQSPYIFNDSVMYNVRYGKPSATEEECRQACRMAGLHDIVMAREGGYDANTGKDGANYSGGERQRILLARAFLERPKIMLIDEGTSAMDSETEASIKQSINKVFAGQTVIIVAHRLSSIRDVDRIIVFGQGCKIVEDGKHDELLAKNGVYAGYWKKHLGEGGEKEEGDEGEGNDDQEEGNDDQEEEDGDENNEDVLVNLD